jgi:hypothetical protein
MSGIEQMLFMTIAGGLTQAVGHSMAGVETARAAEFEAQQYEIQAQSQRTAADQMEARRREELTSSLETIQAIRAGRNVGANSPTGEAILTSAIEDIERDIAIERGNYRRAADLSRRASIMQRRRGRTSLLAGDLQAGADLFSVGTRVGSILRLPK